MLLIIYFVSFQDGVYKKEYICNNNLLDLNIMKWCFEIE